ncbi:MAG: hypothetical protein HYX90_10225 [Chloroflexi bacterium]|nr:hypothetical protein [Chloroflexota bacterium]
MASTEFRVVWPGGRSITEAAHLARRVDNLEGKTIAALWDWVFRGNEIFPVIGAELARLYPASRFVSYEVFGSTHGAREREVLAVLPEELKKHQVDAVVSGVGC